MKTLLQTLFTPILKPFEQGGDPDCYRNSHRIVLNVVGLMFLVLSISTGKAAMLSDDIGFFIPVVVFFLLGFVSLIVGLLGSNGAVAKIWGNRK